MLKTKASILIAGLFLLSCRAAKPEAEPQNEVTVDVAPVLNSIIQLKVTADAVLYPLDQASVPAKIAAPVKKFYVDRGAYVKAGQLLAELENQDLTSAMMESQAAAAQAEAAYESTDRAAIPQEVQKAELDMTAAKGALDAQQKVFDARQELLKQGAAAQKDVNDAQVNLIQDRNQYEIARKHLDDLQGFGRDQEVKAAAAQRDVAKAHHETAEVQLGYSKIYSPISGVVTDRPVFPGEMAQAGAPIITVMDISQVIAKAHVAPRDAALLKVGDEANLILPGVAPIPGKVSLISAALDSTSTTVEVWIQAANPGGKLKPGSSLRVEAIAKSVPSALVIPYAAVLTGVTGSTSVIVVDAENTPHKKTITIGIHDGANVEVLDGLQSGERVVTAGAFELGKLDPDVFDKTKVKIAPPKEEPDDEG